MAVSPSNPANRLWLARHGETEWSASGRHTSFTDLDLTAAGEQEARGLAERLTVEFARVLSSPRLRARRTAELAGFSDVEVLEVVEDLREWDYGEDEGLTTPEIRVDRPGWTVWSDGPKGGESAEDVARRADRIVALVRAAEGPVLAFSHGHFSRVLAARWLGLHVAAGAHLRLSTASLSVLGWERETAVVDHWNDTGSLS